VVAHLRQLEQCVLGAQARHLSAHGGRFLAALADLGAELRRVDAQLRVCLTQPVQLASQLVSLPAECRLKLR
jgi:hypothetical protein